ncbi:MAG: hypothetical protein ACOC1K_06965 [Nanoarchaeota archaeon]
MDKIDWCFKKEKGIRLAESNQNLVKGYLKMAEDSIGTMQREKDKNIVFSVSAGYYAVYYSLYAVMQKVGIKCEIHSCSIEFMKIYLNDFYSEKDNDIVEIAFSTRNILQYYVETSVNKEDIKYVLDNAYDFFVKSRGIISILNENKINDIRKRLINKKEDESK